MRKTKLIEDLCTPSGRYIAKLHNDYYSVRIGYDRNYQKDFEAERFDPECIRISIRPIHTGTPIIAAGTRNGYKIRMAISYPEITISSKQDVKILPEEIAAAEETIHQLMLRLPQYFPGIIVENVIT